MTQSSRRAAVVCALTVAALLPGCASGPDAAPSRPAPRPGPAAPYAHGPHAETSVAGPVSTGGELERLTDALATAGFFCAQVRDNAAAVQIWCRSAEEHVPDVGSLGPDVTVVDLVGTPEGAVQYGHVTLPYVSDRFRASDPSPPGRLVAVLDASFLSSWAEDTEAVHALVADVAQPPLGLTTSRSDSRPAERQAARTPHATYTVAERDPDQPGADVHGYPALELTVDTDALADRTWPLGSASYARTVAEVPALSADSWDCADPRGACVHQPVAGLVWTSVGDRVLTVAFSGGFSDFTPATGFTPAHAGGEAEALATLTHDVRPAVAAQLDRCRRSGESFARVVGGVVVTVDAHRGMPDSSGSFSVLFDVMVGALLVTLPPA